jgi:hypothetical protein
LGILSKRFAFLDDYLFSGAMALFLANNAANFSRSTGLWSGSVFGGYFKSFSFGRVGRFSKPPPQLGQTLCNTFFTQSLQKVHSNVQIIASVLSFGRLLAQCSQTGLISSIKKV